MNTDTSITLDPSSIQSPESTSHTLRSPISSSSNNKQLDLFNYVIKAGTSYNSASNWPLIPIELWPAKKIEKGGDHDQDQADQIKLEFEEAWYKKYGAEIDDIEGIKDQDRASRDQRPKNQESLQCLKKLDSNGGFVNAYSFQGEENNGFSSNHYQINQNHLGSMANVSILLARSALPLTLIFRMKHTVEHIPFISVNCLGTVMSSGLSSPVAATDRIDQIPARLNSHRPSIPDS
ncbi:hypothetical protein BY996DRAFT_8395234 [Phakopsora pachyrhizi]|nr:hypothetical protein BY996DRAFT_8395234 [Phakopsora pachyrhizi]